jgi:predicted dehydrogenase
LSSGRPLLAINQDFDSRMRVVALCDSSAAAARDMAERHQIPFVTTDPVDLLSQPGIDAVAICGPVEERFGHCMAAMSAGKRVLCSSPIAASLPESLELARESDRLGGPLMAANPYRWNREIAAIRALAEKGDLGALQYADSRTVVNDHAAQRTAWDLAPSLDLLRWAAGEIASVMALGGGGCLSVLLRFKNGGVGRAEAIRAPSSLFDGSVTLNLIGDGGAAHHGRVVLNRLPGLPPMTFVVEQGDATGSLGPVREFEASLAGSPSVTLDLWDSVATSAVCAAVEESIQSGRPAQVAAVSR